MRYLWSCAAGATLLLANLACAHPLSVVGGAGFRGDTVTVQLSDQSTVEFLGASVLLAFDASRLRFVAPPLPGTLVDPLSLGFDDSDVASGRVLVFLAAAPQLAPPVSGAAGTILAVDFEILSGAPFGPTPVSLRCVPPFDPSGSPPIDAVTGETTPQELEQLCAPDYLIPFLSADVNVLARSAAVPIAATGWLALLGLGIMGGLRRAANRRDRRA